MCNIISLENKVLKENFNTMNIIERYNVARDYFQSFSYYSLADKIEKYKSLSTIKFRSRYITLEFAELVKKECFFNICKTANVEANVMLTAYLSHTEINIINSINL